jgi:hypothetical protein
VQEAIDSCTECGWEQIFVPDTASPALKELINKKKLVYKQNYDKFKKAADEILQAHDETIKLKDELAKVREEKPEVTQQSVCAGRRLCILTANNQIVLLNAGEFTFGRLGPKTETHFVFNDSAMDGKHFALQINYNLPDALYSCKIKSIGSKGTFVNTTKKIDSEWVSIDANDEITAGNTKMTLILAK